MVFMVVIMLLVCIGFPLAYAWRVLRLDEPSLAAWLLLVVDAAVFVALVLIVGRWDMAGYHMRVLLLGVFLAAVLWSLARHRTRPGRSPEQPVIRRHWASLATLILFGGALAYVIYGLLPPAAARELAFPLTGGRFVVGQGGGIGLLNHHAGHREQRHAADIVAVNVYGYRASGLIPKELGRYVIFGASVVSPCSGEIISARGDLPDLVPPESDPQNPSGNHVIVDCGPFHVELAHLRQGTVRVSAGERVSAGAPLGEVGNSGNTTEPHLHVHAVDPVTRAGVPLSFDGRVPVRNRLYVN